MYHPLRSFPEVISRRYAMRRSSREGEEEKEEEVEEKGRTETRRSSTSSLFTEEVSLNAESSARAISLIGRLSDAVRYADRYEESRDNARAEFRSSRNKVKLFRVSKRTSADTYTAPPS